MPVRSNDRASAMFPHVGGGIIRGGGLCVPTDYVQTAVDATQDPLNTQDWTVTGAASILAAISDGASGSYIAVGFEVAPARSGIVIDLGAGPVNVAEVWVDCADGGVDHPSYLYADGSPAVGEWYAPPDFLSFRAFRLLGGRSSATTWTLGWAITTGLHGAITIREVQLWTCPPVAP